MATRFHYAVPILRQLIISQARRLRRGGLPASLPAPSQDKPFIIVTGAGRSGTSAVARVLHESGVSMGTEFAKQSDANPDGFYEDMGIWWLHERLLTELGMLNLRYPGRWPWRSTVLAVAASTREEMRALIAAARTAGRTCCSA